METEKEIVYYSDNPKKGINTVVTASGLTEYRVNCKKVKGQYYIINKECFKIGNTFYRINTGLIEFDHEKKEWFLVKTMSHEIIKGIIGFDAKGNEMMGYFSANYFNNVRVNLRSKQQTQQGAYMAMNQDMLIAAGYAEYFPTGVWYSLKEVSAKDLQVIRNEINHTHKGYNIEDNHNEYELKKKLWLEYPMEFSKDVQSYAKMLGDTSFGIEFECSKGWLPDHLQYRYGIVPCRDGSLNDENTGLPGPEYVTIPYTGARGLQSIVSVCNELSKRNDIDLKCSLHIHLGNIPKTKIFLVSIYRLAYKIQNELFLMFPYYKANPEGVKPNGKNYNQKLQSLGLTKIDADITKKEFNEYLNDSFCKIFSWLSDGVQPNAQWNRKVHQHPIAQKWNRTKRYFWMNAMNAIFSERNTIEFRPHTPTTNSQKVINWLFICNAIIKFADTNYKRILMSRQAIKMDEILDYYANNFGVRGQFLSDYLKAYVKERSARFFDDYSKGDRASIQEMKEDKNYVFKYGNVTHLF